MRLIAENMSFIESTYGKDSMEMADFLSLASFQLADKSEFDSALDMAERAVEICRFNRQEESYTALQANMDRMVVYVTKGDIYSAYDIAKNLDFTKFFGNDFLSDIIKSVGLVLINLSMYDEAKALAQKVLNTKKLDRISKVLAAEIMIICYEHEGNIDKAQQYLLDISNEINSLSILKFAKDYLLIYKRMEAKIYFRNNDYKSAVERLNSAIELYEDKKTFVLLQCYQDRGVYLTCLAEYEKARDDFVRCEEIIEIFGLSDKINFMLYNNIAIIHFKRQEYEQAEEYYEKIFDILPDVRNPENYTEALICQNYGWIEYNLEKHEKGEDYIKRALHFYEQKKMTASDECILAQYNLSLIYTEKNDYESALPLLVDLYNSIGRIQGEDYTVRAHISTGIITGLLLLDKAQQAYDFANAEDENFADLYGKESIERIDYLQKTAGAFKFCGHIEAFEFLEKSRKLIKKARLENSVWQASQDNYVGVVFLDLENDAQTAQIYFESAKALLENLSQQDTPLYSFVESNLQQAKDKIMDELIKRMAQTLIDEEGENK